MAHSHHHATTIRHAHMRTRLQISARAFAIGITLNTAFVVAEAVFGLSANSTALIADAGHNFTDVLGSCSPGARPRFRKRPPTTHSPTGPRSSSILAALANAGLPARLGRCDRLWKPFYRLLHPRRYGEPIVMAVAALGIVINGGPRCCLCAAVKATQHPRRISCTWPPMPGVPGVVIAAALLMWTGRLWIDPVIACDLRRDRCGAPSAARQLEICTCRSTCVPIRHQRGGGEGFSAPAARWRTEVHDLHIWPISTDETALTCHLVRPSVIPAINSCRDLRIGWRMISPSATQPSSSRSAKRRLQAARGGLMVANDRFRSVIDCVLIAADTCRHLNR